MHLELHRRLQLGFLFPFGCYKSLINGSQLNHILNFMAIPNKKVRLPLNSSGFVDVKFRSMLR